MPLTFQMPWSRQSAPPTIDTSKINLPKVDIGAAATDAKHAVSAGADQLAAVAHDVSREASKIGREAAKKAGVLAASGEATLRTLGADAKATVDDLRSIRVVKQRGPNWRPGLALLAGISAGLAAMFFLDPEQGRRRRVLATDQLRKWLRISGEWLDGTARDVRNRSIGLAHEARKAVDSATESIAQASEQATDADLATDMPDVAAELDATDQSGTEYPEPTYVGERTH